MYVLNLTNKVAIVTGSTAGIGKATAHLLAQQGATVVVTGRREAEGQAVVSEITAKGGKATSIKTDVTSATDNAHLFEQTKSQFGKIDIVFLNSGVYSFAPLAEQTEEDLTNQIDVNIKGVYFGLQQVAKHVAEGGSVIINSSTVADFGMPGASAYSLTKGAVNTLVRTAAVELAPQKIRVNAVSPGPIWTEGMGNMTGTRENAEAAMGSMTVIGRVGEPNEIAAGVVFLASDEASYVTGQIWNIDGGIVIK
ncbi:MAG: oxidoreductase [Armatimonadetes bacterium Cent15-Ar3]|nr:MAG: oxidoreductase [Armatimonadetes bacterium Cent15-Ar3]